MQPCKPKLGSCLSTMPVLECAGFRRPLFYWSPVPNEKSWIRFSNDSSDLKRKLLGIKKIRCIGMIWNAMDIHHPKALPKQHTVRLQTKKALKHFKKTTTTLIWYIKTWIWQCLGEFWMILNAAGSGWCKKRHRLALYTLMQPQVFRMPKAL